MPRIKRQILSLYHNTEQREFEIRLSDFAFGNFEGKYTVEGVPGMDQFPNDDQ